MKYVLKLFVPMQVPTLYLMKSISKKRKMSCDTKIPITLICTIKEIHDFGLSIITTFVSYQGKIIRYMFSVLLETMLEYEINS